MKVLRPSYRIKVIVWGVVQILVLATSVLSVRACVVTLVREEIAKDRK